MDLNPPEEPAELPVETAPAMPAANQAAPAGARSTRPPLPAGRGSIDHYTQADLRALVRWVRSDGRLHTKQEIVADVTRQLGFARRGAKIVAAVKAKER